MKHSSLTNLVVNAILHLSVILIINISSLVILEWLDIINFVSSFLRVKVIVRKNPLTTVIVSKKSNSWLTGKAWIRRRINGLILRFFR